MKKVILTLDDNNNLVDENGMTIICITGMGYDLKEFKDEALNEIATKLVGLGVSPDDLIKMKAVGII